MVSNRNIKRSGSGKRTQWLLFEEEESGVEELYVFGQIVQLQKLAEDPASEGKAIDTYVVESH